MFNTLAKSSVPTEDTDVIKSRWFDLIANNIPATIWVADGAGQVLFMSRRWFDYVGLAPNGDVYARWSEAIHPDDVEMCLSRWQTAVENKSNHEVAVRVRHGASGKFLWHIVRGVPVTDPLSGALTWVGAITDINDQKNSEILLQLVIDSIPGSIWWKDAEGKYVGCNKATATAAGYNSTTDLIGKTDFDMPWSEHAEFYRESDCTVMENNEPVVNRIESITCADGKTRWIETNKVALHDLEGNTVGTVGNYVDISERLKLIQQREDFMASLAHDLKIPIIGSIRAFDVLLDGVLGPLSDNQSSFLAKLQVSQQQLLTIIQNVLQVLRYESSPDELQIESCNLSNLVNATINDVTPIYFNKELVLTVTQPESLVMAGDGIAIKRMLLNLLGNAAKFTPNGGTVNLDVEIVNDNVQITVCDTGPGISKDDQAKLFQRFWQGGTVKRYAAETGLGLYLCRQIAEGHGGTISVSSELGAGACFIVSLPIDGPSRQLRFTPDHKGNPA